MNGFNTRRKRNFEYSSSRQPLSQTGINWGNEEVELEEDYEELEVELGNNEYEEEYQTEEAMEYDNHELPDRNKKNNKQQNNQLYIDGKPFVPRQMPKKQTFNDTHVRITTYLEKNVHQIIHMLLEQGQIESISKFINDSIKEHLMNNYHNNN